MAKKTPFQFRSTGPIGDASPIEWEDWRWQFRRAFRSLVDFQSYFALSPSEIQGFTGADSIFRVQSTPYYTSLASPSDLQDPIRQMILPRGEELSAGAQALFDPLGENKPSNRAGARLVHRYSDRVLFLLTDLCSVYCRYCTRKHFTANDHVLCSGTELEEAVRYVSARPGIREVIFSGGDPLTVSSGRLETYLKAFYDIPHVELIRIGTRMPVVCPMRIDDELIALFKKYKPVYLMTHFNHPDEITKESARALEDLVDGGVPVFNQMVLLSGVNNHPALVQALSRRLLYLRVKPYYMFQADPSQGTDHLRNSIEDSLGIQKDLWGHISGLMMPTYIIDIPNGGGKAAMVPDFEEKGSEAPLHHFKGWDGVRADYISPKTVRQPQLGAYGEEWRRLKEAKANPPRPLPLEF